MYMTYFTMASKTFTSQVLMVITIFGVRLI